MTKNRKSQNIFQSIILTVFIIAGFLFVPAQVEAAYLYFDPNAAYYTKNSEFEIKLILDTEGQEITGVDIIVNFDKNKLEIKSVSTSSLFNKNDSQIDNGSGKLTIYSTMDNGTSSFNAKDRLATIKFKALNEADVYLSFNCSPEKTNDSNIWKKGDGDIINCAKLTQAHYKIEAERCDPPQPPTNIKAVSGPGDGEITLSWDKGDDTVDYYSLTYGPSSLNYIWGASNIGLTTTYKVTQLQPGKPYYFIVTAVNECGSSGAMQEVAAYAGMESKQKPWQPVQPTQPTEIVQYSEASASALPSTAAASPEIAITPAASVKPILTLPEINIPSLTNIISKIPNWLKWLIISLIILISLAIVGRRLVHEEGTEKAVIAKKEDEINNWPPGQNEDIPPWLHEPVKTDTQTPPISTAEPAKESSQPQQTGQSTELPQNNPQKENQ